MKKLILILFIAIGFNSNIFGQSNLKRIEITKETKGKIEKQVFKVFGESDLTEEIDLAKFPKHIKQKIKDQLATEPLKNDDVFEFSTSEKGTNYSVKIENLNENNQVQNENIRIFPNQNGQNWSFGNGEPKAYLGMKIKPYLKQNNSTSKTEQGVLVDDVIDGEAAYNAGLQKGDIITSINNLDTPSPSLFQDALNQIKPRDPVTFKYIRNGMQKETSSIAGLKQSNSLDMFSPNDNGNEHPFAFIFPDSDYHLDLNSMESKPMLGISIKDLNNKVTIDGVEEDSPAQQAGLEKGDIIESIDGKKINSPNDVIDYIGSKKIGDQVKIKVNRNGKTKDFKVTLEERKHMFQFKNNGEDMMWFNEEGLKNLGNQLQQLTPELEQKLQELQPKFETIIEQIIPEVTNDYL